MQFHVEWRVKSKMQSPSRPPRMIFRRQQNFSDLKTRATGTPRAFHLPGYSPSPSRFAIWASAPKNRQTDNAHLWYKTSNRSLGGRFHRLGIGKEQMSDTSHESHGFSSHDSFATRYLRLTAQKKSFKIMRSNNSNIHILLIRLRWLS